MSSENQGRRLISIATVAYRFNCSVASIRRHSKKDPNFPAYVNVNNRLFAFEDEIDAYQESLPRESTKPLIFQRGETEAAA